MLDSDEWSIFLLEDLLFGITAWTHSILPRYCLLSTISSTFLLNLLKQANTVTHLSEPNVRDSVSLTISP